eukprot:g4120.t1
MQTTALMYAAQEIITDADTFNLCKMRDPTKPWDSGPITGEINWTYEGDACPSNRFVDGVHTPCSGHLKWMQEGPKLPTYLRTRLKPLRLENRRTTSTPTEKVEIKARRFFKYGL